MKAKIYYKAFGLILSVIFLSLIIMVFIYGFKLNLADNKKNNIPFYETGNFSIFVGGAVENEKFYEVRYSTTYGELFLEAGALENSSLKIIDYIDAVSPFNDKIISKAVNRDNSYFVCNYENFTNQNINYAKIEKLIDCGINEVKAKDIRNYIDNYGCIKNKYELVEKGLLTKEEFEEVKYKIYAYIAY